SKRSSWVGRLFTKASSSSRGLTEKDLMKTKEEGEWTAMLSTAYSYGFTADRQENRLQDAISERENKSRVVSAFAVLSTAISPSVIFTLLSSSAFCVFPRRAVLMVPFRI